MINCIIVDDEVRSRDALAKLLSKHCPDLNIVAKAEDVETAKDCILKMQPELVFLDVEMSGNNGFDLLNEIKLINFDIIFVTAHEGFAVKAFRYSAIDYLTKPIDYRLLIEAVNKFKQKQKVELKQQRFELLIENLANNPHQCNRIAIPNPNGFEMINISDIIFCQADGNYTNIHLLSGLQILSSKTLKHFEDLLPKKTFFRIHKSFLININLIEKYERADGFRVIMKNKVVLEVSERNRKGFTDKLTQLSE